MSGRISRREALGAIALGTLTPGALSTFAQAPNTARRAPGSMYRLEYKHKHDELIADLLHSERGDPNLESATPHGEWYSAHIRKTLEGWGPKARAYPVPEGLAKKPLEWMQERAIAVAARFFGYGYQHHHIPDWDPPADWPWKKTCVGHNGKGVDCSNFTSFVYNQGFGVKMSSAIERQSELKHAEVGEERIPIERVAIGSKYAEHEKVLRAGDLLYIRGREEGPITHVVLWVGSVGRSPGNVPLIIDSHGANVKDENGEAIPCGVHIRPFREDSWYNRCASHAHRIFV